MESPPKRITRARAAKASQSTVKTTKIVTAATKAKSTATASTKSTTAKRKTRADENDDDQELEEEVSAPKRITRGRPRKAVQTEEPASAPASLATKPTRGGRAANKAQTEPVTADSAPAKATRGRPRKAVEPEQADAAPQAKTTRSRAATTSKAGTTTTTAQPTMKKTVKFQEPDKENFEPAAKKGPASGALRGRPPKRGPATVTTKASAKMSEPGDKKPLSPRKVTQMPISRGDESEDELAGEAFVTVKPMQKSPVKPPSKGLTTKPSTDRQLELDDLDPDSTLNVNDAILNPPSLGLTSLASPARRVPPSPFIDTMKSPARKIGPIPFPGSALKSASKPSGLDEQTSFKNSLLHSAARRPPSPIKALLPLNSAHKSQQPRSALKSSMFQSPAKRAIPGMKPLIESRHNDFADLSGSPAPKPLVATPGLADKRRPSEKLLEEDLPENLSEDDTDILFKEPIGNIQFSGRLSAVFPREIDPDDCSSIAGSEQGLGNSLEKALEERQEQIDVPVIETACEETSETRPETTDSEEVEEPAGVEEGESLIVDEIVVQTDDAGEDQEVARTSPPGTPAQPENPIFQLRQKDLDPCHGMDSDDEDDSTLQVKATPTTSSIMLAKESRRSTLGFTTLADQFGAWATASPVKALTPALAHLSAEPLADNGDIPLCIPLGTSQVDGNFFEDEMHVRHNEVGVGEQGHERAVKEDSIADNVENPVFDDVMLVDEDFELAQEANEMSLREPTQDQSHDDTLSDASQEYGDENQVPIPIDPALGNTERTPMTPVRPLKKTFNTTTKVPLKPADESTPSPLKKRSFSASRVAPKRPTMALSRNATVISYSPTKERKRSVLPRQPSTSSAPATPREDAEASKTDIWSTMGTPARTPRKDLNPALLRGAVVHVDVHTSEGADASGIFVELLTQMGARCVKTWHWNPNSPSNDESSSNKIGITHVVYKDGGKRTLEKVRQSNGVVQCVGVSWVLDCERENEWLDEAPYYIDTSLVPRGGARRRKSMEPKALANMNGTLINSSAKAKNGSSGDMQAVPNTPMNRRQSAVWMHTPSDQGDEEDEDDIEWSKFILTPVPKTPAPEAISRYAAELVETPGGSNDDMDESPTKQALMMRTCPPKSHTLRYMGEGILEKDKDEQVLLRLMEARRKSLQFAPKIGSPLARTWN